MSWSCVCGRQANRHVSVRQKEVKSGWIILKGSRMKKLIGIIMWKKMQ